MAEVKLDKLVIHFAQSNKAEGKSPKTISWYSEMLGSFIRYLKSQYRSAMLSDLDIESVRAFIIYEQERGVSAYTVQGKVRALKAFSSWLSSEGYTPDNLLYGLKLPRIPAMLIEPLTPDEIDRLIKYQNPLTAIGCRDIAIFILMVDTGIRLSELCNTHFEDAHVEDGYMKVMDKGSKERIIPVGAIAQKMLWRYIIHFRPDPIAESDNYLFLRLDGKPVKPNAVKLLLNRWGKKAGVPRLHAHLCRHTFAANFLVHNCGDVFRLQHEGWLYVAAHQDLFSGNIVGYAMGERLTRNLVSRSLFHALIAKRPVQGLIHHSDRGSQYCSHEYRDILARFGLVASMSRRGNCLDNAPMESFWGILKQELVHHRRYRTRREAIKDITEYIEIFYNRQHRQAKLGFLSPAVYEQRFYAGLLAA
jgi:site-specific recombinase XerD